MSAYHFLIRKADHQNADGSWDLHVHAYIGYKLGRKLLGRYRIPTLEPVFSGEPKLKEKEIKELQRWLANPKQIRKLRNCLQDSIFNLHKLAEEIPAFGDVMTKEGETYIHVRIPISRRLE